MNADSALFDFYNSFEIPAFPETAVPDDAKMPYITYTFAISALDEGEVYLNASIWYKTESEKIPTEKAMEIYERIGRGGIVLPLDSGYLWLKRGSPFAQSMPDEDNSVKLRYLNITAEYLT